MGDEVKENISEKEEWSLGPKVPGGKEAVGEGI